MAMKQKYICGGVAALKRILRLGKFLMLMEVELGAILSAPNTPGQ